MSDMAGQGALWDLSVSKAATGNALTKGKIAGPKNLRPKLTLIKGLKSPLLVDDFTDIGGARFASHCLLLRSNQPPALHHRGTQT